MSAWIAANEDIGQQMDASRADLQGGSTA